MLGTCVLLKCNKDFSKLRNLLILTFWLFMPIILSHNSLFGSQKIPIWIILYNFSQWTTFDHFGRTLFQKWLFNFKILAKTLNCPLLWFLKLTTKTAPSYRCLHLQMYKYATCILMQHNNRSLSHVISSFPSPAILQSFFYKISIKNTVQTCTSRPWRLWTDGISSHLWLWTYACPHHVLLLRLWADAVASHGLGLRT